MPPDPPPTNLIALRDAREQAIAQLSDAFANDVIEIDEFERRLTLAHRASSAAEIAQTVSDLTPAAPTTALAVASPAPIAPSGDGSGGTLMAIFGGVERSGLWRPPSRLQAFAILGGMVLDFREALLLPGVTEIQVLAVMGGAQIIVPPGLSVEVSGTAIMGGFAHVDRVPERLDPDRAVLRVHGLAFMGGVSVETRLPGESEREAHRRRKHERRGVARRNEPKLLPRKTD